MMNSLARVGLWFVVLVLTAACPATLIAATKPAYVEDFDYTKILFKVEVAKGLRVRPEDVGVVKQLRDAYVRAYKETQCKALSFVESQGPADKLSKKATEQKIGFVLVAMVMRFRPTKDGYEWAVTQEMQIRSGPRWQRLFRGPASGGTTAAFSSGRDIRALILMRNPAEFALLGELLPLRVTRVQRGREGIRVGATVTNLLPFKVRRLWPEANVPYAPRRRGGDTTYHWRRSTESLSLDLAPGQSKKIAAIFSAADLERAPKRWVPRHLWPAYVSLDVKKANPNQEADDNGEKGPPSGR